MHQLRSKLEKQQAELELLRKQEADHSFNAESKALKDDGKERGRTEDAGTPNTGLGTSVPQPPDSPTEKFTIVGTWMVSDARTKTAISSVRLAAGGQYQGGTWGKNFGGPNGIGANQYSFEDGTLSFVYVLAGRARIDEMLVGHAKTISPTVIDFTVTGGYYGTGKNVGTVFRLTK